MMGDMFQCFLLGTLINMHWSLARGLAFDSRNRGSHDVGKRSAEDHLTNDERKELIDAHNYFRSRVDPKASNMLRMYWSAELEAAAQYWTNKCIWKHGYPDIAKTRYNIQGQNMHMGGPPNMTKVITSFSNEVQHYNFGNHSCTKVCGHYTQVVWAKSYLVGCAKKFCPGMKATIVTCNYFPPGNYVGSKPYTSSNKPCSECGAGVPCKDNLCDKLKKNCSEEINCNVKNTEYCLCDAEFYALLNANRFSANRFLVLYLVFVSFI